MPVRATGSSSSMRRRSSRPPEPGDRLRKSIQTELSTRIKRASAAALSGRPSRCLRRSEEHTSELQSLAYLVCRLLLEKKKTRKNSLTSRQKKEQRKTYYPN